MTPNPDMTPRIVASPCVDICRIDADNGLCVGCWRTLDEIAHWTEADANTRLSILAAIDKRRAEHDPAGETFRGECER